VLSGGKVTHPGQAPQDRQYILKGDVLAKQQRSDLVIAFPHGAIAMQQVRGIEILLFAFDLLQSPGAGPHLASAFADEIKHGAVRRVGRSASQRALGPKKNIDFRI